MILLLHVPRHHDSEDYVPKSLCQQGKSQQCTPSPAFSLGPPHLISGCSAPHRMSRETGQRNYSPQHCSPGLGDLKKQRKLQIEGTNTNLLQKAWSVLVCSGVAALLCVSRALI